MSLMSAAIGTTVRRPKTASARLGMMLFAAAGVAAAVFVGGDAQAVTTCVYSPSLLGSTATAAVTVDPVDGADLKVGLSGIITVNGIPCFASVGGTEATVTTTDEIKFSGSGVVTIDLTGGRFEPGMTTEPDGISEIEFTGNLNGASDGLVIKGVDTTDDPDNFAFGASGVSLNSDNDADMTITGFDSFVVNAGGGNDTVSGQGGFGSGSPFTAPLTITGGTGDDNLEGSNADDKITGGDDPLSAGDGNDTIAGRQGDDTLVGGDGTDTADYSKASDGVVVSFRDGTATGGDGSDSLSQIEDAIGSAFDDTFIDKDGEKNNIRAGDGNDTFVAGVKKPTDDACGGDPLVVCLSDVFNGDAGINTVDYSATEHHSPGIVVDLPLDKVHGSEGYDSIPNVQNVIGSAGDDTIVDQDGERNNIFGSQGDDTFVAGVLKPHDDAADSDQASPTFNQSDAFDGGPGSDTADYEFTEHHSPGVIPNLPLDRVFGSPQFDSIPSVENIIGSGGADTITLQDYNIPGEPSSGIQINHIDARGDDDIVHQVGSSTQGDVIVGGDGFDTLDGAGMNTTASLTCDLNGNTFKAGATPDAWDGENCGGSPGNDTLTGDAGDNTLNGGGGNDTMTGGGGNDNLQGGEGNDTIDCGAGTADIVSWEDTSLPVSVNMQSRTATGLGSDAFVNCERARGGTGNDTMSGSEVIDYLMGNAGDDNILGGKKEDVLFGDDGNDYIDGGEYADEIHGGNGNDILKGGKGRDKIYGDPGDDQLFGGDDDDFLDAGPGTDYIDGGGGRNSCLNGETVVRC